MLEPLRAPTSRRLGFWARGIGIGLLVAVFFLPLPAWGVLALLLPGLALFVLGAVVWLVREPDSWRR